MTTCIACSLPIDEGRFAKFCGNCGQPYTPASPPPALDPTFAREEIGRTAEPGPGPVEPAASSSSSASSSAASSSSSGPAEERPRPRVEVPVQPAASSSASSSSSSSGPSGEGSFVDRLVAFGEWASKSRAFEETVGRVVDLFAGKGDPPAA